VAPQRWGDWGILEETLVSKGGKNSHIRAAFPTPQYLSCLLSRLKELFHQRKNIPTQLWVWWRQGNKISITRREKKQKISNSKYQFPNHRLWRDPAESGDKLQCSDFQKSKWKMLNSCYREASWNNLVPGHSERM